MSNRFTKSIAQTAKELPKYVFAATVVFPFGSILVGAWILTVGIVKAMKSDPEQKQPPHNPLIIQSNDYNTLYDIIPIDGLRSKDNL